MTGSTWPVCLAWVGAGSALGGLARYGLDALGGGLFAVFMANTLGALAIGMYAVLSGPGGTLSAGSTQRLFVMPGLLGGLTSFSVFSLQADALLRASPAAFVGFVLGALASWAVGVALGDVLGQRLNARLRPAGNSGSIR